jgi:hypothetical protein
MACCGQKRDSLRSNPPSGVSVKSGPASWPPSQPRPMDWPASRRPALVRGGPGPVNGSSPHHVALRYTESSRIIVEGSATRRHYEFSASDPVKLVDSRDAGALLSTRFFVRG